MADLIPAEGWEISDLKVDYPLTEIAGKEEFLNQVVSLKTAQVEIPVGQKTFKGVLKLEIPEGISSKITEVGVSATIRRTPIFRTENGNQNNR